MTRSSAGTAATAMRRPPKRALAARAPVDAEEPAAPSAGEAEEAASSAGGAAERAGPGRPSKYRDDFARQAAKLCSLGATDEDLGEFFDVSARTIRRWKVEHEAFCGALKLGKGLVDDQVERSLYQRAVGYSCNAVKVFTHQGQVIRAEYREHYPPDTTAAIFWLKNRRPEQWRDKQDLNHGGNLTVELVKFANHQNS